jgi:hypothetical protein
MQRAHQQPAHFDSHQHTAPFRNKYTGTNEYPDTADTPGDAPDPSTVVLDFVSAVCTARWSNNGEYLLCPGDPNDTDSGYVARLDNTTITGDILVEAPSLITIPAYNTFGGIFGHYPALEVWEGDTFHAILACQPSDIPCNVDFGLSYFDSNGGFHDLSPQLGPLPISDHDASSGAHTEVVIDLSSLAGQTVEFTLVVRTEGDRTPYNPIWISPYIQRNEWHPWHHFRNS